MVPTTAVLYDEQNFPFVYVQVEAGKFAQRQVTLGRAAAGPDRNPQGPERRRPRRLPGQRLPAVRQQLPGIAAGMIDRIVSFALSQRFMVLVAMVVPGDLGRRLVSEPADRRLSRSGAAARPDRDAVARTRGRRSRAADHDPARDRDERHPEARRAALDFPLRAVVGDDELRLRHRSVLRARAGVRAHSRRGGARRASRRGCRRCSVPSGLIYRYVLQSPDRSAQDLKILEEWVLERKYRSIPGRRRRLGARRHDDAVPGAARSEQAVLLRRQRAADRRSARREQRQRRRRLLLAGRPVLLRPRPRPGQESRGHRQHRRRHAQRHSRLCEGRRDRRDRPRAAARAVRLHADRTTPSKASS